MNTVLEPAAAPTATDARLSEPLLKVQDLKAAYGTSQVLFGVSLDVRPHEVVTLIGRNGMGKTTTVKTLMGLLEPLGGTIEFDGQPTSGWPPHRMARAGMALVPEGRRIFPNLTVRENLVATAENRRRVADPWTLDRVISMFPRLGERERNLGCNLSGGEQQMLAIGRALMTNPLLLILDEATEGLAPLIRDEIWACLDHLRRSGLALIVIDKHLGPLQKLASRHYVMEKGHIVWSGDSARLTAEKATLERYLGV